MAKTPCVIRLACPDDLPDLIDLFCSKRFRFIGDIINNLKNVRHIFNEYQAYRFVAVEQRLSESENSGEGQKIVAYAAFKDYPPIEALPSDCWLNWLHLHYCVNLPITLMNTMFLNFCIYDMDRPNILPALLTKIFSIELKVNFLIVVKQPTITKPKHNKAYDSLIENFNDIELYGEFFFPKIFSVESCANTQSLLLIKSESMLPSILYRKALAEDNDDVVELLDYDMPELREEYGDYFISEALLCRDLEKKSKNFLIITEIEDEKTLNYESDGFLWLCDDIDMKAYVRNYELDHFGNLVNFNRSEPYVIDMIDIIERQEKNATCLFTNLAVTELKETTILGGLQKFDSGISVASISKMRVKSIDGALYVDKESKYYERESIFIKFQEIFQELRGSSYYVTTIPRTIYFAYNIGNKLVEHATPNDTMNSFFIKYCCISPKYPVELVYKYLVAAFSAFPDRDYCLFSLPKTAKPTRIMTEMLQYFILVNERPSSKQIEDNLYIVHRSIIQGEISIHELRSSDIDDISKFTYTDDKQKEQLLSSDSSYSYISAINVHEDEDYELQTITEIMKDILNNENSEFTVLTIRCGISGRSYEDNTFVGYVALRPFQNCHYLHSHFHLPWNDDVKFQHKRCEIIMLKLHPFFHRWSNEIFRSLSRKTDFFDFFYIRLLRYSSLSNDLENNMMPIEPLVRKKVFYKFRQNYHMAKVSERYQLPTVNFKEDYFHVFRHTLRPIKFYGNKNNIVIIGFTDICKAFLRQMIFQWNSNNHKNSMMYTCLTDIRITVIVSPGIVEAEFDTKFECPICNDTLNCYLKYQNESTYVRDTTRRIDLRQWVHFVPALIHSIDRTEKCVKLRNKCDIHYDTLLLMCASNFAIKKDLSEKSIYRTPVNVEEINTRLDRILLLYKIKVLIDDLKESYSILVYGSNLQTYECLNFLVTHGVKAKCITLVLPFKPKTEEEKKINLHYEDINIQYILEDMVSDLGITVHQNLNFKHYLQHTTMNFVSAVVFTRFPKNELIKIYCDMFINFEDGTLMQWAKVLLQNSEILLQDSRIIVDENYCTNDSNIYAIGRNIYMPSEPNYQYVNTSPREAAEKLMRILNLKTDYDFPFEYKYSQPAFFQAQLPLNYFFTKLTLPRRFLMNSVDDEYSFRLTTYHHGDFSRVRLNRHNVVDEIVCVSKSSKRLDFLEHICGKHEALLNNLLARYKGGLIKCFIKFFQEPWTELIMHEDFELMHRENHQLLSPIALSALSELERTPVEDMVMKMFQRVCKSLLEQRVLDFLRQRRQSFVHPFALPEDFKKSNAQNKI